MASRPASRPPAFVGIDPGREGAAVVLAHDGVTVLELVQWARAREPVPVPVIAGDVVAVEAAYVGRNVRSAMSLQFWRGRLIDRLPDGITLLEPLATTWRGKVLRRPRIGRDAAKALAMEAARKYAIGLPDEYPDHVAESWLIARFAWGWAAAHPMEVVGG
jgi:hypothetical protein